MAANCLAVLQTHGLAARMVPKWLEILFDNQVERRLATRDQSIMWASVCKAWRFWFLARLPQNKLGELVDFAPCLERMQSAVMKAIWQWKSCWKFDGAGVHRLQWQMDNLRSQIAEVAARADAAQAGVSEQKPPRMVKLHGILCQTTAALTTLDLAIAHQQGSWALQAPKVHSDRQRILDELRSLWHDFTMIQTTLAENGL